MADINTRFRLRTDTSTTWASVNPVLAAGEPGWESNTKKLRMGDGVAAFTSLPYLYSSTSHPNLAGYDPANFVANQVTNYTGSLSALTGRKIVALAAGFSGGWPSAADKDFVQHLAYDASNAIQIGYSAATQDTWRRGKVAGVWDAWRRIDDGSTSSAYDAGNLASNAQALAGTSNSTLMTPLRVQEHFDAKFQTYFDAAHDLNWDMIAELTIVSGGSTTWIHAKGRIPRAITLVLLCKTAEAGYSVGDWVYVSLNSTSDTSGGNGDRVTAIYSQGSDFLSIKFSDATSVFTAEGITGGNVALTNSRWRLRLYAIW